MASFWNGKIILKEDFENKKTFQNIRGQMMVRPLLFYQEKFNQLVS